MEPNENSLQLMKISFTTRPTIFYQKMDYSQTSNPKFQSLRNYSFLKIKGLNQFKDSFKHMIKLDPLLIM